MKIIYITNARMPTEKAHGYQIAKMCEEFARAGVEVELVVPKRHNNIKENAFSFYDLERNFKIKYINTSNFLKYTKTLKEIAFYLQSILFLIKTSFLKINKDVIIYTRNLEIAWFFALQKHKTIFEAHTWPESKKFLYKLFLKPIKNIIVISKGIKDEFLSNNLEYKNILVAPDGVDLERFDIDITKEEARRKLNLPLDKKIILYTGHLYKWKGVQILADSTKYLDRDTIVYFVGGTQDDRKNFLIHNKYLINNKKIVSIPCRPNKEMPLWLKAADILVLPNIADKKISSHYTSPLKMFEYMASKRPIIASDLPSIREILDESCASFFCSGDSNNLSRAIKDLLANPKLQQKISQSAYIKVQGYTWQKRAQKILDFIKKII